MNESSSYIIKHGLTPKMKTNYQRKAFIGDFDIYSRVTFDRRMRCYPETAYNIFPDRAKFVNYDHQDQFDDAGENVVLELKCELKVPGWMQRLIRNFELRQAQFSKYDSSWTYLETKGS